MIHQATEQQSSPLKGFAAPALEVDVGSSNGDSAALEGEEKPKSSYGTQGTITLVASLAPQRTEDVSHTP